MSDYQAPADVTPQTGEFLRRIASLNLKPMVELTATRFTAAIN
jgi:hypothetical protein